MLICTLQSKERLINYQVIDLINNFGPNFYHLVTKFSDAPYIVKGVYTYQDVCVCSVRVSGHLNRFGPMIFCQNPLAVSSSKPLYSNS